MTAPSRPHIIYILSDQHRGQAMSHAGDSNVRTPHLDRLAAEGASFSRAYANCPVCTPSRGTIFSGRHAHSGPVSNFFGAYPPAAPSTATILREHGYHTSYIGKWHCGVVRDQQTARVAANPVEYPGSSYRTPENRRAGFQDWAGFEVINSPFQTYFYRNHDPEPVRIPGYQTDVLTDEAIRQLEAYDRHEPLFLVLSVEPPHFPCLVPQDSEPRDPRSLDVAPSFARLAAMFSGLYPEVDEDTLRQILCNYYAMVENLDANIGRLMRAIQSLPRFQNSLVVYFSDHGDYVGNHGIGTCKINHHEESVRVPAIFWWPGRIPARGATEGLFSLVDMQSTVCGLASIGPEPWDQGHDWSKALRGVPGTVPAEVLLEMCGAPRWNPRFMDWRGFVTDRWKYAYYEDGRECLHDLLMDPFEMTDLAVAHPEMLPAFRDRLLVLLQEAREPFFDVLIRHGVRPETPHYLPKEGDPLASIRRLGGLVQSSDPLPMA